MTCWTAGTRLEWFRDTDGTRVAPIGDFQGNNTASVGGFAGNFYDVTAGLNYHPNANVQVRPEIRYDWSSEKFFDGLTSDNQFTAAVDVIFNF